MSAGSIADRFGYADTFGVVETGLPILFCGSEWQHMEVVASEVSIEAVFKLLCCAEGVHYAKKVNVCGAYMGGTISPDQSIKRLQSHGLLCCHDEISKGVFHLPIFIMQDEHTEV